MRQARTLIAATLLSLAGPLSSARATPAVQWRELGVPRRAAHVMVRDTRRNRMLLFGGDSEFDFAPYYPGVWQLVALPRPHWEPIEASGAGPLPRSEMAAVYDSLRDRVLVFGGRTAFDGPGSSELWQLSLSGTPAWSLLDASAGVTPPARFGASLVLDAQDRLVLFGGDLNTATDPDVYLLPLGVAPLAWQDLPLAGPGARARHGAVYSRTTHRMTVFGGDLHTGIDPVLRPAETWELVLDAPIHWVKRASAPADSVPVPETNGAFVANGAGTLAWLIPGDQGPEYSATDASVWQLDLVTSTWTRIQNGAGGPSFRTGPASAFDPASGGVLLHGGYYTYRFLGLEDGTGQTFRFRPGDPSPWSDAAPVPVLSTIDSRIDGSRMLFDQATRTLVTFDERGVWTCDLGTGGVWRVDAVGAVNAPPYRDPVCVIDPLRRRLLVFGGVTIGPNPAPVNQLWSWPLDGPGAWTTTAILGSPPPVIRGAERAYDPARDRVVVLPAAKLDTVAALELSSAPPQWTRLATQGGPPARRMGGAVVLDAARDRLVLSGGQVIDVDYGEVRDLWTLDLAGTPQWTQRLPNNLFDPKIAPLQGLVRDPVLDRLLLLGGGGQGWRHTIYSTPLATLPAWTDFDPDALSPMWGAGAGFYDAAAARALFWNGTLWEITWPGSASTPPVTPPVRGLALAPPRPNPASGDVTLELASDHDAAVTIDVFDTSGRRVAPVLRRRAHAGRESFPLALPRRLPPGLYLVRASDGARTTQVRLAITR